MICAKLTRFAGSHEEETIRRALPNKGAAAADDASVGYALWWDGAAAPLSRREHQARHRIYAEYRGLTWSA